MEGASLEVSLASPPRRLRPERLGDGRAARGDQPGNPRLTASRRRLGRGAVANHARAHRPRPGGGRGNAGLRRDRRRDRRQHGPRGGGEVAAAGRRAPGDLHHPPAAGRLAGRGALSDREASPRRPGEGDASTGWTATSWWPRSSACSAPSETTRPPAATPASCWPPPERSEHSAECGAGFPGPRSG